MAKDLWVVVPTYWTAPGVVGAFDHPTPFDGESTLPRLLESLARQEGPTFRVLLLAGCTNEGDLAEAERALRRRLEPFRHQLSLAVAGVGALRSLQPALQLEGRVFNLLSYAGIRNLQLLIPYLLGAEIVIALDDDEVVAPDYIARAAGWMRPSAGGRALHGLSGPYADAAGELLLAEPAPSGNIFLDKARYINQALNGLLRAGQPIVPTSLAFGGNMIFARQVIQRVGFDPGITRGEDMDYLINARIEGVRWWMAPQLTITHLPPRHYEAPEYEKLRKDIIRFCYERAKIRRFGLRAEDFDPYPGRFLRDDLEQQAQEALAQVGDEALFRQFGRPADILRQAQELAQAHLARFPAFRARWQADMARWGNDKELPARVAASLAMD